MKFKDICCKMQFDLNYFDYIKQNIYKTIPLTAQCIKFHFILHGPITKLNLNYQRTFLLIYEIKQKQLTLSIM